MSICSLDACRPRKSAVGATKIDATSLDSEKLDPRDSRTSMDKLHLIQNFIAVVDQKGFAGAARVLSVSPPVVTRAVNELEGRLGVRLLTRTTRVVRVTDAGARYAEDCRRILEDLQLAASRSAACTARHKGT